GHRGLLRRGRAGGAAARRPDPADRRVVRGRGRRPRVGDRRADRHVDHHLLGLCAVRDRGRAGRRGQRDRGDPGGDPRQRTVPGHGDRRRPVDARQPRAARARGAGDHRHVAPARPDRADDLRAPPAARGDGAAVRLLGAGHGGRRPARAGPRGPRGPRARRPVPRLLPLPPGQGAAVARVAARRGGGRGDRARPHPDHAAGRAGDRRLRGGPRTGAAAM
ncbi:MAG: hypothetical protein AVDCRST_MAG30-3576, partial [uncultured Solirubrobacteraceae bacterium]